MKAVHFYKISRFYFGSFILFVMIVIALVGGGSTSASDEANENPMRDGLFSERLKTIN